MLEARLRKDGHEVIVAEEGNQAWGVLQEDPAIPLAILLAASGVLTFMPVADWIEAPRPDLPAPPRRTLVPHPVEPRPIPSDDFLPPPAPVPR